MARKGAPGAGRPPRGDIKNKVETFTTRITAETRRALEASAKEHDRSLSQEAEIGLRNYLEKPSGAVRNRALAYIVCNLAAGIEAQTGKDWRSDVFSSMALRGAIEAVLLHFAPAAEERPLVPEAVERRAEKMPPEFAVAYRRPVGLGHFHAHHLIAEIESASRSGMINEWTLPITLNAPLEKLGILAKDLVKSSRNGDR